MQPNHHTAFTLIELLVVVVIILVLAGLALPAIGLARRAAAEQRATSVVQQLGQAMDSYRLEDRDRRFPSVNSDQSLTRLALPGPGPGALEQLEARGLYHAAEQPRDTDGRILDPWGSPYRYSCERPTPPAPADALRDWNWDAANNRVRAWGRRVDPITLAIGDGALPFAYLWSLGTDRSTTDATTWIYIADARP